MTSYSKRFFFIAIVLSCLGKSISAAEPVDGFLTPFETVEVATGETGVIQDVLVRAGDSVLKGDILVRLQDDIHCSQLVIAETAMNSTGRLEGAQAELRMRQDRLEKLQELHLRGSARPEEITRSQADLEVAAARVHTIEEEMEIKRLEHDRAQIQWARRAVRAPLDAVVLKLHKKSGEFAAPGDPKLITLVQLDPLLGVFAVPSGHARRMRVSQRVQIRLTKTDEFAEATVERIAPVIDVKSGTVRVELRVGNSEGRLYSGEQCELLIGSDGAEGITIDAAVRSY